MIFLPVPRLADADDEVVRFLSAMGRAHSRWDSLGVTHLPASRCFMRGIERIAGGVADQIDGEDGNREQ